jgi:hypothetical protein
MPINTFPASLRPALRQGKRRELSTRIIEGEPPAFEQYTREQKAQQHWLMMQTGLCCFANGVPHHIGVKLDNYVIHAAGNERKPGQVKPPSL